MDKPPHLTLVPGDDEDNLAGFRAKVHELAKPIPPEKYRGILGGAETIQSRQGALAGSW